MMSHRRGPGLVARGRQNYREGTMMLEALDLLREDRRRIVGELRKIDRAIRALGGKRRGRKPGTKVKKVRSASTRKSVGRGAE